MRLDQDISGLLKRIADSDNAEAFKIFFEQYHAKLLSIAHVFVASPQMAEDIVSDVMVKLLKNRKETFRKENFLGYLYRCIKNQALDQLKKKKQRSHVDINYNDADYFIIEKSNPCSQLMHKEFEDLVTSCIESMPPKRKLVFKLVKDDGLSYKEVASQLNISERTVEVHLRLAVGHIRTTIDSYLDSIEDNPSQHLRMVN